MFLAESFRSYVFASFVVLPVSKSTAENHENGERRERRLDLVATDGQTKKGLTPGAVAAKLSVG